MNCYFCSDEAIEVHYHHLILKSEGGRETVPACRDCHIGFHSQQNHFAEWGRKGGLISAERGHWVNNLWLGRKDRGGHPPDPARPISGG